MESGWETKPWGAPAPSPAQPSFRKGRQREEPTVSSSQGDRGSVDGDRHGVVLDAAAMEVMLQLRLRGGGRRGRRVFHPGGAAPHRADHTSPQEGAHPQGPGCSWVKVLHGQCKGQAMDWALWRRGKGALMMPRAPSYSSASLSLSAEYPGLGERV